MATTDALPDIKYMASLQTEEDTAFLHERIAAAEEVPAIASMYQERSDLEQEYIIILPVFLPGTEPFFKA